MGGEERGGTMSSGKVFIVGAGPGDPELMTVKAVRVVRNADVVLHDSLVGEEIIRELPRDVRVVDVGKDPAGKRTPQHEINHIMVSEAERGKTVVRLKGGDPNVFGRGGEEMEHLSNEGIEFEVVPGVSSIVSTGTYGIPLTHRNISSSFTVITGHENPSKNESALDWNALASNVVSGGTLVILMGVKRLPDNMNALIENGVPSETPVAVVENASLDARVVSGTLDDIVEKSRSSDIEPPAVTVVGDVVGVREKICDVISSASVVVPEELTVSESR